MKRVYVSLPANRLGRDVLRGAQIAAEGRAVELVPGGARAAVDDPATLAYLGDFYSRDVAASQSILGPAGVLQVAPVATWIGLAGPTLVRISPHDGVGAVAIAEWLVAQGVASLLVLFDHDEGYGRPVGALCTEAAAARGLDVVARPIGDRERSDADAVLYVGVAGSGAVAQWEALHAANPGQWLLGSEGVAQPWFARSLSAGAASRTRCFVAQRATFSMYGYEAMALILDTAGDAAAARSVRDRDSVLGRYSIEDGHTTSRAYGRVAVVEGELVWDI